jgi:hypothetical protein
MGSKQASRYIKQRMGDELKNKILERHGIRVASQPQMVSRTWGSCGYVNKLESKFCERSGCHCPQTQLAKMQELVNESNLERDDRIRALQQPSKSREMQSAVELCKNSVELSSKQKILCDTAPLWSHFE